MKGNRLTTRYSTQQIYPSCALSVRNLLSEYLSFAPNPKPGFKDGIVASYAMTGDSCYSHVDPRWHDPLITVHCNVIVNKPESGGDLIVDDLQYEMPLNNFICYPVSELTHKTTLIVGNLPRIMWVFGFCVTKEQYLKAMKDNQ